MGKYNVIIKEKKGTCESELFEKMAKNGDLVSTKVSDLIGTDITVKGYADTTIETEEKTFDLIYVDTEEYGLITSGSEIFKKSIIDYFGEVTNFTLRELKTKKGKTYKAIPVLTDTKKAEIKETEKTEDLPF